MPIKNLAGQTFGHWTVISLDKVKKEFAYWICQCSACGNKTSVRGTALLQGRTTKCATCARSENGKKNRKDNFHVASGSVMAQYKNNAKTRGIAFKLTRDQIKLLMTGACYYCGNLPANTVHIFAGRYDESRAIFYNGIDRVDNTKGYIIENCVSCCKQCNWAKRDLTSDQFKNWIKRLYLHMYRGYSEKTPGLLVDELFTTNMKLWYAQEDIMKSPAGSEQALVAAKRAQELNAKRTAVMRTIDKLLDFTQDMPSEKTYA